jgi:hypothetical protein
MNEYGFIIIRNVNNESQNEYWIESYNSIRKFYPEVDILIVDNNSNKTYLKNIDLYKCEIIESEYPESRHLSAYYYHNKLKKFNKAIIIHDSVFVNNFYDFSNIKNIKFLWHFETHLYDVYGDEMYLIDNLKNNEIIKNTYLKKQWNGCLGNMSIISHSFLNMLNEKYNFLNLKTIIKNNAHQCAMERIFPVLCYIEDEEINKVSSVFGDITTLKWGYTYNNYLEDKNNNQLINSFIKTFAARQ